MCGLIGAFRVKGSNWDVPKVKNFLSMGLQLSQWRGDQGTGVGLVSDTTLDVTVTKSHLAAVDFLRTDMWDWVENQIHNSHVILGHTRYPTFSHTVFGKYAQPYHFENTDKTKSVLLTHNGHVNNHSDLTKDIKGFYNLVDSAHVTRAMAEATDSRKLLANIKGGYALIWYDDVKRTMNVAKNDQRELYMAVSKDNKKIFYASEDRMLEFLLDRADIETSEILHFEKMQHYEWDLDAAVLYPVPVVTKYKEKVAPIVEARQSNYGGFGGKKGSPVWVHLYENARFMRYPAKKEGEENEYGKCFGGIHTDKHALVEIEAIRESFFNGDLQLIRDSFPCRVTSYEMEDSADGRKFPFYKVHIDYAQIQNHINMARKRKELLESGKDTPLIMKPFDEEMVNGPDKKIKKSKWLEIAKEGCFYCTNPILSLDINKVGWHLVQTNLEGGDDKYLMVCPTCVKDVHSGKLETTIKKKAV